MNKHEMRRNVINVVLAIFGVLGVIVTILCFDAPIDLPPIEWRWIIFSICSLILILGALIARLHFANMAIRNGFAYNIESCEKVKDDAFVVYTDFIDDADYDQYVTIYCEINSHTQIIGYGTVSELKRDKYVGIDVIREIDRYKELWDQIKTNNKGTLLKTHILLTINCGAADLRREGS